VVYLKPSHYIRFVFNDDKYSVVTVNARSHKHHNYFQFIYLSRIILLCVFCSLVSFSRTASVSGSVVVSSEAVLDDTTPMYSHHRSKGSQRSSKFTAHAAVQLQRRHNYSTSSRYNGGQLLEVLGHKDSVQLKSRVHETFPTVSTYRGYNWPHIEIIIFHYRVVIYLVGILIVTNSWYNNNNKRTTKTNELFSEKQTEN